MSKASAVSRYLGGKDWTRSEWFPSGQVRGWGHQSTGYKCEDWSDFNHRPCVRVSWIPGDGYRMQDPAKTYAMVRSKVHKLKEDLSEKYLVQYEEPDATFGGDPYLMVYHRFDSEAE